MSWAKGRVIRPPLQPFRHPCPRTLSNKSPKLENLKMLACLTPLRLCCLAASCCQPSPCIVACFSPLAVTVIGRPPTFDPVHLRCAGVAASRPKNGRGICSVPRLRSYNPLPEAGVPPVPETLRCAWTGFPVGCCGVVRNAREAIQTTSHATRCGRFVVIARRPRLFESGLLSRSQLPALRTCRPAGKATVSQPHTAPWHSAHSCGNLFVLARPYGTVEFPP
jgi:hypothetical protein